MYKIKKPILGFEKEYTALFEDVVDGNFAVLQIGNVAFTLINPYLLVKDYSFEIPADVRVLLEIDENNPPLVYCNLVKKDPFIESIINLKAPILLNPNNNTLAQVVLDEYDFVPLKEFIKE